MPTYTLSVNSNPYTVSVSSAEMPLLWVLRDVIGLTGTKYGCGIEACGACTVWVNGEPEKSCKFDISSAPGKAITTIEGLAANANGAKAQQAWVKHQVPQCGFCQPGTLMCVAGAMNDGRRGREIAGEVKNLCACGTYQRMNQAIATL